MIFNLKYIGVFIISEKWHIDINGKPAKCTADIRACTRGEHFESQQEAQKYVDRKNENEAKKYKIEKRLYNVLIDRVGINEQIVDNISNFLDNNRIYNKVIDKHSELIEIRNQFKEDLKDNKPLEISINEDIKKEALNLKKRIEKNIKKVNNVLKTKVYPVIRKYGDDLLKKQQDFKKTEFYNNYREKTQELYEVIKNCDLEDFKNVFINQYKSLKNKYSQPQ